MMELMVPGLVMSFSLHSHRYYLWSCWVFWTCLLIHMTFFDPSCQLLYKLLHSLLLSKLMLFVLDDRLTDERLVLLEKSVKAYSSEMKRFLKFLQWVSLTLNYTWIESINVSNLQYITRIRTSFVFLRWTLKEIKKSRTATEFGSLRLAGRCLRILHSLYLLRKLELQIQGMHSQFVLVLTWRFCNCTLCCFYLIVVL